MLASAYLYWNISNLAFVLSCVDNKVFQNFTHKSKNGTQNANVFANTFVILLQFFSSAYTQNLSLSHSFWKLTLKQEKHTPNLQNHEPLT